MQRSSSDDRVFLTLIRKVDEGTESKVLSGPSEVEKLRRPDLPLAIWEVLEVYSDVFPSKLPKSVILEWMGHKFKINLEDETPPIHRPLYKLICGLGGLVGMLA